MQSIEHGPNLGETQIVFTPLIALLQPEQGFVLISEIGVNDCHPPRRNVGSLGKFLQVGENLAGTGLVPAKGLGIGYKGDPHGVVGNFDRRLQLGNRFGKLMFCARANPR